MDAHADKLARDSIIWSRLAGDTVQRLKVAGRLPRPMAATAASIRSPRSYGITPISIPSVCTKDGQPARPLNLTPREQTDLVVFLESLSTFSNPWRPDDGGQCH